MLLIVLQYLFCLHFPLGSCYTVMHNFNFVLYTISCSNFGDWRFNYYFPTGQNSLTAKVLLNSTQWKNMHNILSTLWKHTHTHTLHMYCSNCSSEGRVALLCGRLLCVPGPTRTAKVGGIDKKGYGKGQRDQHSNLTETTGELWASLANKQTCTLVKHCKSARLFQTYTLSLNIFQTI